MSDSKSRMQVAGGERLLTADEVRVRLGAMRGLKKIRYDDWRAMLWGGLKGIPIGKRYVFRWSTVLAFLETQEQPVVQLPTRRPTTLRPLLPKKRASR